MTVTTKAEDTHDEISTLRSIINGDRAVILKQQELLDRFVVASSDILYEIESGGNPSEAAKTLRAILKTIG